MLLLRKNTMVLLPLLLRCLSTVVVVLIRRHVVSLHGYLDWLLLVRSRAIVLLRTLVSVVLVLSRRMRLLLHWLLLPKLGRSVGKAALSFIRARIL